MEFGTAVFLNAIVSATADVCLNDLSRHHDFAKLMPYFRTKSIVQAASISAATVGLAACLVLAVQDALFGRPLPTTWQQTLAFASLAFVLGFVLDVLIDKFNIFKDLKQFYRHNGSGFWGGLSLLVSMLLSLLLQRLVLPVLQA